MQFWVYILRCRDGSYYTGHTDKLELRLAQHREGLGCDWTARRLPVELVWCGDVPTREEALAFERRVKNWSRAKKEAMMAGDWARVGYFARPPHERPSTSLGTNGAPDLLDGESRRTATPPHERPSTSLGTNEDGDRHNCSFGEVQNPFVPSEVEGRRTGIRGKP